MPRTLKSKKSVTLDQNVIDQIERLAERDSRSFSQYVNMVLRKHLEDLDPDNPDNKKKADPGTGPAWLTAAEHGFYGE